MIIVGFIIGLQGQSHIRSSELKRLSNCLEAQLAALACFHVEVSNQLGRVVELSFQLP